MRTVIFVHIPKAAGSTLHAILQRRYAKRRTRNLHTSEISAFAALPLEQRANIELIKGHIPFGIHEHLPNDWTYITMLRHPVERVISHYYYVLRRTTHNLRARIIEANMDLEEYVTSGVTHEMDNAQVRLLSGHDGDLAFGECTEAHLQRALHNLRQHFSVVGLTERFDDSVLLMQHALGWRNAPCYAKRNARPDPVPAVRASVRKRIEETNRLDMILYEQGRSLFDVSLRTIPDLERRHLRYRRRMSVLSPCLAFGERMGRTLRARLS